MNKVTLIKKDAKASIEVGTGLLECLQKLLIFLVNGKTEQELESFKQQSQKHTSIQDKYDEEWMDHFKIITTLAAAIEKKFLDQNQVEEVEIPDDDIILPEN
jgi:aromatic ring-opening dioxygenase catalytic subunit (LigB family)